MKKTYILVGSVGVVLADVDVAVAVAVGVAVAVCFRNEWNYRMVT